MEQSGTGILYAFAYKCKHKHRCIGGGSLGRIDVKCNYWGSYSIDPTLSGDFAERLGSAVVSYAKELADWFLGMPRCRPHPQEHKFSY